MTAEGFELSLVAGTGDVEGLDGHVDHAALVGYVARVRETFLRETVPRFEAYDRPVARLEVEYHGEVFPGHRLTGTIDVEDVGETSLTTEVTLRRDGMVVTTGRAVQVLVDPESGEPTRVPDGWRAALT